MKQKSLHLKNKRSDPIPDLFKDLSGFIHKSEDWETLKTFGLEGAHELTLHKRWITHWLLQADIEPRKGKVIYGKV